MILVIGATGQLGNAIVLKLAARGSQVRAFVRRTSKYEAIEKLDVELAFGDLRDPTSLDAACQNVDTIIATANAAIPSDKRDSFQAVDGRGYENLIDAAKRSGVRHFIYCSALSHPAFDKLPIGQNEMSHRRSTPQKRDRLHDLPGRRVHGRFVYDDGQRPSGTGRRGGDG